MTTEPQSVDLDGMTQAEQDALPVGVVGLDAAGTVTHYNAAQARISGVPAAQALGRNFFREVEPATNQPHFAGRFLDGVRRGALDESFPFVFSADPRPLRTEVSLWAGTAPGRYWMTVEVVARLEARRERAAQLTVGRRFRAEPVDPSICEREPIHVPGAVQPHAMLLAADLDHLTITVCSENAAEVLGLDPAAVLGHSLDDLLPNRFVALLRAGLAQGTLDAVRQVRRTLRLPMAERRDADAPPAVTRAFLAHAHVHDGRLIIELELAPAHPEDFAEASHLDTEDAVTRLREALTLDAAAAIAAREVRALTGFEAVLVYRFDADWNGEAVAEDKVADWDRALLGLRFPASDIPAQARALYTKARSRFVIDRDYVPVALSASPESGNAPVDLTYAQARSLSPIHLEYQRNLGVNGSMSISILVEDRLWGLMIGHHRRPHYVAPETRAAATVLTDALALRVSELESRRLWRERQEHLATEAALLRQMAEADDFVAALTRGRTTILDLFGATGAATIAQGVVTPLGRTPPTNALLALAEWVRGRIAPDAWSFTTHELPAAYGAAWVYAEEASGVLAAFLDPMRQNLILWLRPEEPSTVTWGGDPRKAVVAAGSGTVLPRRSFERWIEERRGICAPFPPWQVDIAEALAGAVEGVVLRQSRKITELTALLADKERLLAQKDLLTREIDHRVKNSLQIVSAFLQMQRRQARDPEAREAFAETAARVMSVARVHDSLYQAESVEEVDLGQTIETLCNDLAGMAGGGHDLDLKADTGLMVPYRKAVALSLIATELVTNAFKYAYLPGEGGRVEVTVRGEAAGHITLSVSDQGRGLPEDWQQGRAQGTGLGMKLVRAMLDQINARLEVADGVGARFTVHA